MAARRCTNCEINYPTYLLECVVCDQALVFMPFHQPAEDWEDLARAALNENPELLFIFIDFESPRPHRANAEAEIIEEDGQLFITHQALLNAGYSFIEPDTILWLNQKFFEVQGYDKNKKTWWIKEIDPDMEFTDLPVLSEDPDVDEA